jgi:Ankyrin repeats (3 copies)
MSAQALESKEKRLCAAILANHAAAVERMLAEGGMDKPFAGQPGNRMPPLNFAAFHDRVRAVRVLISRGANIAGRGEYGDEVLHHAASGGYSCIPLLLAAGASVDAAGQDGRRPLHAAASNAKYGDKAARLLYEAGADPMARDDQGQTHLHIACQTQQRGVVAFLLQQQEVDLDQKDNQGLTPAAAFAGVIGQERDDEILAMLLDTREVDPTLPLSIECFYSPGMVGGSVASILLLEAGADADRATGQHGKESLVASLSQLFDHLYLRPKSSPIAPCRRALSWILSVDDATLEAALLPLPSSMGVEVESIEQLREARESRLSQLRGDAWKRRRHLCLDRALWRKPAATEPPTEAKAGAGE